MTLRLRLLIGSVVTISGACTAHATTYTTDTNLADFTALVSTYATFSNYGAWDGSAAPSPYTPTTSTLDGGGRVYAGGSVTGLPSSPSGQNWILATFPSAVSSILVFPNIDHVGPGNEFDGYQYKIYGSNNGTTWTALYDTITVSGSSSNFTIGNFSGTAPVTVNNVLTPGAGPGGEVGYEASFNFGTAYTDYAFGASTIAFAAANIDPELSAVGDSPAVGVPGPTAGAGLPGLVFAGCGFLAWWRRKRSAFGALAAA